MSENDWQALSLLVVEDDAGDFGLIKALLRRAGLVRPDGGAIEKSSTQASAEVAPGASPMWAKSLADAARLAHHQPPDLVLLDLSLPDSIGLATVRALRQAAPDAAVIVLTGNDDTTLANAALEAGAQDYLVKGQFDADALARAVRHSLARRHDLLALRASETRYRSLFEDSRVVMMLVDPADGRIVDANARAAAYYGYAPEVLRTMNVSAISPMDHDALLAELALALDRRRTHFEFRHRLADGQMRNVEVSTSPVAINGQTLLFSVVIDITERIAAEEQLRIAAAVFESHEGMFVTDASETILRVNQAFTRITGYTAIEAIGQKPSLLSSGRHDAAFYAEMAATVRNTGAWQGEIWNRRKNGEVYPEWLTITAVHDDVHGTITHYVATLTDISSRKSAEAEIKHLAFYDALTGLPNRRLLIDRMQQTMASSERSGREGALLFIDLDNFKVLNDTQGHDVGDLLLQQVAERLSGCIREGDTVSRLGGDEFVVMLEDLSEVATEAATQTEAVGEKIIASLNKPYRLGKIEHYNTPSIGATLFRDHLMSIDEILKRADIAMYQAKSAGRNTLRFFDPGMQALISARGALETDLREALLNGQFVLFYQCQVGAEDHIVGAEALLRWQHPRRGLVMPGEFIPLAEETGLILPLGRWVLETACAQIVAWAGQPATAGLTLSINVSSREFRQKDFVERVLGALDSSGADPLKLKLELTESLLVDDLDATIDKMNALKARGVGFSLDDFGTGYSSLSYLKRLPLDELKIDQSFVRDVLVDANDAAIARTIIALGQTLGLAVIAEGVETTGQRDFLAAHGCLAYQGYLFGLPGEAAFLGDLPATAN